MQVDNKALKTLLDYYWKPGKGWRSEPPTDLDIAYAKQAGLMFDDAVTCHDDLVKELQDTVARSDRRAIADAFVASLSSRRLDLRSALASYAVAAHLPGHRLAEQNIQASPHTGAVRCPVCGVCEIEHQTEINLNVLNFERFKWGGVRKTSIDYVQLDLAEFLKAEATKPTSEDYGILCDILSIASALPDRDRPSSLGQALKGVLKSNASERRTLIESFGVCGILSPQDHPTYFNQFVECNRQSHTGEHFNDWGYPVIWWRGSDGVNSDAVAHFFPDFDWRVRKRKPGKLDRN